MTESEFANATVCDPKKLNRTAWWLVALIVVGGTLIYIAYVKWAAKQYLDDRPAIVHRIQPERSLRVVRQDGTTADLMDLRGSVFVLQVVCLSQSESSTRSSAVMKHLSEKYSAQQGFHLVTLVLDPFEAKAIVAELGSAASQRSAVLPQWWLAGTEPITMQTFVRKELKPSVVPELVDGKWLFDSSLVLIDKNGHLRRAVVPQTKGGPPYVATFDFEQAAKWDADGKLSGTGLTNEAQLEVLLGKTIDQLLAETYQP
jgi:hypothetical protein